jgi:hypothetical protein
MLMALCCLQGRPLLLVTPMGDPHSTMLHLPLNSSTVCLGVFNLR